MRARVVLMAVVLALLPATAAWAATFSVSTTIATNGTSDVAYANGYVVQADSANVFLFDSETNTLAHTLAVAGATSPRLTAVDGNTVYIANSGGSVTIVDTVARTATVVSVPGACSSPERLLVVGTRLYVTCIGNGRVSVMDTVTRTFTTTLTVGNLPRQPSLAGGKVFVPNENSNSVTIITDAATPTVTATIPLGSRPVSSTALGTKSYMMMFDTASVAVIDSATNTLAATISVGGGPQAAAVCGGYLVVTNRFPGTGSFIDPVTNAVTTTSFSMGSVLHAVEANAGYAYFADYIANTVSAVDCATQTLVGSISVTNPQDMAFSGTDFGYFASYSATAITVATLPSGNSGSGGASAVDRTPPPWLRQVGRVPGAECEPEWGASWAEWPNRGSGGPVCTQTLVWSNSLQTYVIG